MTGPLTQGPISYFSIPASRQLASSNGRVTHNQALYLRSITVFVHGVNNGPRDLYCAPMITQLRKGKITTHSIWPTCAPAARINPLQECLLSITLPPAVNLVRKLIFEPFQDQQDSSVVFNYHNLGSGDYYDYFIRFNWGDYKDSRTKTGRYNPAHAATFRIGKNNQAITRATIDDMNIADIALAQVQGKLGWQMTLQQWAGVNRLKTTLVNIHNLLKQHMQRDDVSLNIISHSQGTVISMAALQLLDEAYVDNWYLMGSTLAQEILEDFKRDRICLNEAYLQAIPVDKRVILENAYRQREDYYKNLRDKDDTHWPKAIKHVKGRIVNFWSCADNICNLPLGKNIGHYGLPDNCIVDDHVYNVEVTGFLGRGVFHSNWWKSDWITWSKLYRNHFEYLLTKHDNAIPAASLRSIFKQLCQIAVDAIYLQNSDYQQESKIIAGVDKRMSGYGWRDWANKYAPASNSTEDLNGIFKTNVKKFIDAIIGDINNPQADVQISNTKRDAKRCYLFHWAWRIGLGRCKASEANEMDGVPINWIHKDDDTSKKAARDMIREFRLAIPEKDAIKFEKEYAEYNWPRSNDTPPLNSRHIGGNAIDMIITWRDTLKIKKPNGEVETIADEPRNGNNKTLQKIGKLYNVYKITDDEPHWYGDGK